MVINQEALEAAVHEALSGWHAQAGPPKTALDDLLLVQTRQAELARDGNPLALRLAANYVLWEALALLERHDETAAHVLRWRFPDNNTLLQVANRLNVSEHTVSRLQRAALSSLAALLVTEEMELRQGRIQEQEALLPPPSYTRLFGVEERRDQLATELGAASGPGVVALVGIGGIGKTALADAVTRDLIQAFAFEDVFWLRYEARTMSGQALSAEHAFDALLMDLVGHLGLGSGATSSAARLVAVRQHLKGTLALVIIDNLESEAVADYFLDHLLGLAGPSKFLLTTRTHPPGQAAVRQFSLPELSPENASRLLRHHATEIGATVAAAATDEEIGRIYAVTGGNPLALKLVVGLLDLLPLGHVLADLAHSRGGAVEELYRHIYWQTWRTLSEPARRLLQAMPLVAESGGEPDYLKALSQLDDDSFWSALQQLRSRSLLEVRGTLAEKRYGIHRLTETFVRTEIVHWHEGEG
jgi:hypothetical protein